MLFPSLLTQTPTAEMKWTGDVKAFAYFAGPACRDEDWVATVYVARKLFEDGSTVTVVRNVPRDGLEHLRASMLGEGRVERDPSGQVTRLDSYTQLRPHGGSYSYYEPIMGKGIAGYQAGVTNRDPQPNPVTLDRRVLKFDPKSGFLRGSWERGGMTSSIALSGSRAFWLDRLEAVAFGSTDALATGWRFAIGSPGGNGQALPIDGTLVRANDRGAYAVELAGQRVMLRRVDLGAFYPGTGQMTAPFVDTLLLRQDGGLAAYVPGPAMAIGPSSVGWDGYVSGNGLPPDPTPPIALKGKLKEAWDRGLDARLDRLGQGGVFLPTTVSPETSRALMETIGEPERPETPAPEKGSTEPPRDLGTSTAMPPKD